MGYLACTLIILLLGVIIWCMHSISLTNNDIHHIEAQREMIRDLQRAVNKHIDIEGDEKNPRG